MQKISLKNGFQVDFIEKLVSIDGTESFYIVEDANHQRFVVRPEEIEHNKIVNKRWSKYEKLALYYDYFKGRPDVYATKWVSKTGKTGFSPAGEGYWMDGEKGRRKVITQYYPYTLETVENHILGQSFGFEHGVGIYPMLENDQCQLIVIDFDNEGAVSEAKSVVKLCKEEQIDVLIERSQSGHGIHLWFFFAEPISAKTARYFGKLILRAAMMVSERLEFTTYDRIIPMQDTLTAKGFGNIIALPLRAEKVKEGKTVFLNEKFEIVEDFWTHLANIKKYQKHELHSIIDLLSRKYSIELKQENAVLEVSLSGELVIDKKKISRKELVQLAELATIHNPEYYIKQSMREPVWNIPQRLTLAWEDDENFYLPRGILNELKAAYSNVQVKDLRTIGHDIKVSFKGKLYKNQLKAFEALQKEDAGILIAPTGFGKTVLGAALIAYLKKSTLIIAPSKVIAKQWKRALKDFLEIETEPFIEYTPTGRIKKKDRIGEIYGTKNKQTKVIDVTLFQSLARKENLTEFLKDYDIVIVDEVHHSAAPTFDDVLKQVSSRYLYGFTATLERKDGLEKLIDMRFGEIIYNHPEIIDDSILIPKYFYPRYTNYIGMEPNLAHQKHLAYMQHSKQRNALIINDIEENMAENRSCLVLTQRIEHIFILAKKLETYKVYMLHGQQADWQNKQILDKIAEDTQSFIVIATGQYAGEGLNIPKVESLFLALPFSWKGKTQQYLGRLHRYLHQKTELRIYDYVDAALAEYSKMFQNRLKSYVSHGYVLAEDEHTRRHKLMIYQADNFKERFAGDIAQAKTVVVSLSYVRQSFITYLNSLVNVSNKVKVYLPRRYETMINKWLPNTLIHFIYLDDAHSNFLVTNDAIVWHGNLVELTQFNTETTVIRLVSDRIKKELVGSLKLKI